MPAWLSRLMLKTPYGLMLLTALFALGLHFAEVTGNLDRAFFDQRSRSWARSHPVPTNAALVLVDEASLKRISEKGLSDRWPWNRELFAAIIASLHQAGASRIVLDFIFEEDSDNILQDHLLAAWSAACRETIMAAKKHPGPVFWTDKFKRQFPEFQLEKRFGHVDYPADSDGVIRSYFMRGSLAAKATERDWPAAPRLLRWHGGLERLKASGVPVLSVGSFVESGLDLVDAVNKRVKNEKPDPRAISRAFQEVFAAPSNLPDKASDYSPIRGKVVFVGANAAGTFDLKATPVGRLEPGVLVHFTAWANGQQNSFLIPVSRWMTVACALVFPTIVILTGWHVPRVLRQIGVALFMLLVVLAGSAVAFNEGVYFPPAESCGSIAFGLLCITAQSFWLEEARRREIQQWFGSYVSHEVVENLVRNPDAIRLGGEKKELTVFFSDLAGFTDMSEKMEPEDLLQLVNLYLSELSPCIIENGGYLDKYIGDAIMGVFGSPAPLANHAASACRAALASRDRLAALNPRIQSERGLTLRARMGVNSGAMIVGNLGSELKKNYTVIGDAVNLASRLEGANKEFGTAILLGENTEERIRGLFVTRPVSRLRVKGKQRPIQTHELIDLPDRVSAADAQFIHHYSAGYAAFMNRDFATSRTHFSQARSLWPEDLLCRLYLDKTEEFLKIAPNLEWDGVIQLTSK